MDLTRRDAIAALAASGVAVGGSAALLDPGSGTGDAGDERSSPAGDGSAPPEGLADHDRETLVAVADVVYPGEVSGIDEFVSTYLRGRATDDPSYAPGAREAIARLDDLGREWHGGRVVDLDAGTRDRLLREVGAATAEPVPDGSPAERVRYYVVNELLYALYASPTGGKLVGIENPQGHPGGQASYRRGPGRGTDR